MIKIKPRLQASLRAFASSLAESELLDYQNVVKVTKVLLNEFKRFKCLSSSMKKTFNCSVTAPIYASRVDTVWGSLVKARTISRLNTLVVPSQIGKT